MSRAALIPKDAPPRVASKDLAKWFGTTTVTIRRWWLSGTLPKPVRVGPRTFRWDTEELRKALGTTGGGAA